jgi:hypothetical protein
MSNLVVNGDFSNDLAGWTLLEQNNVTVYVHDTILFVDNSDADFLVDIPIISQVIYN